MSFLELKNCSKGFGDGLSREEVLKNINLEIAEGEFVAILGFSGTGKSTCRIADFVFSFEGLG